MKSHLNHAQVSQQVLPQTSPGLALRIGQCFTTKADRRWERATRRDLLKRELSAHAAATAFTALSDDDR